MKILLLLVLKCLIYSKITGLQIRPSHARDVISEQIEPQEISIEQFSKQSCIRIKRDLSTNELLGFGPAELDRSPRRKRAVLRNQNKIFFRRRQKKLFRKSKIRKSLFRRGKFTTRAPYKNNLKKYAGGKGKIARPPGLKYRKRYRFNTFKKTQDVALGVGADGRAPVKRSPPKKRPPIHVRDYERGRGTRKAFRGRVGERKLRDEGDRRRGGAAGDRRKGAAKDRVTTKKSNMGEYYEESSDYSSELGEDSLPKPTKAQKPYSTFGRITKTYPWGNATKQKKATKSQDVKTSEYDYSSEDNTLLLSDEEELTDVSSEIEALRSELSDERPRHRKNASSSEYAQYSYAEDDSAIVKGDVVSSKDESIEVRVSFPQKTTLLGPIKYEQYDIKKLDASMERVFKKKKSKTHNKANIEYDDPFEDLEVGYKDETSYESSSDKKQSKQKGKKSKSSPKKRQEKSKIPPKKIQLKTKSDKLQAKARTKKDSKNVDSHGESDYDSDAYTESDEHKSDAQIQSDEHESDAHMESDEYDSDLHDDEESSSRNETEEYTSDEYDSAAYSSHEETEESSSRNETEECTSDEYDSAAYSTHEETEESSSRNQTEEYTSDEYDSAAYSSYEETSTPIRRVPTWKVTQHSKQETLYEEYSDTDDNKIDSKPALKSQKDSKMPTGKVLSTKKQPSKKDVKTTAYQSENYDSEEYSYSESSDFTNKQRKSSSKRDKTTKRGTKTPSGKVTPKTKLPLEKNHKTSSYKSEVYDSAEYSDSGTSCEHHSDKSTQKKHSLKSGMKSKKVTSSGKTHPKKGSETSTYESDEYDSDYSDESIEKKSVKKTTAPKQGLKVSPTKKIISVERQKKSKSRKNDATPIYESAEYYSDNEFDEKSKKKDFGLMKSFGLGKKEVEKDLDFLKEHGLDIINAEKDHRIQPIEKMNTKIFGLDIVRAEHDQKLPPFEKLNLTSSDLKTSLHESNKQDSDYSDYSDENHKIKNFGLKDLSVPFSGNPKLKSCGSKAKPKKDQKKSLIQHGKKSLKQTTWKKLSEKTTKKKHTPKKSHETSYEESDYDSEVTSYEYSSDDASQPKKSSFEHITSFKKDHKHDMPSSTIFTKKTTYDEGHKISHESGDIDTKSNHIENHSNEKSLGSYYDENELTTSLLRKTTLTTRRRKKGFTTLPTTTTPIKGFNSAEALQRISSKAAAITKNHILVYNTKKKAYELVHVDSVQPHDIAGHSAANTHIPSTKTSQSPLYHSKTTHPVTIYRQSSIRASNNTISKHTVSNNIEMSHVTEKTLKKRIVYKKTTSEVHSNLLQSTPRTSLDHSHSTFVDETSTVSQTKKKTTRKRSSRKTTLSESRMNAEEKTTRKRSRRKTTLPSKQPNSSALN